MNVETKSYSFKVIEGTYCSDVLNERLPIFRHSVIQHSSLGTIFTPFTKWMLQKKIHVIQFDVIFQYFFLTQMQPTKLPKTFSDGASSFLYILNTLPSRKRTEIDFCYIKKMLDWYLIKSSTKIYWHFGPSNMSKMELATILIECIVQKNTHLLKP